jgi:hypothetical protein
VNCLIDTNSRQGEWKNYCFSCPVASGSQKTNQLPTAAVQFGQLVGQANAQSQLCVQYETAGAGQPGLATSPVAQAADSLLAAGQPSQIIGSQLVQQRSVCPSIALYD